MHPLDTRWIQRFANFERTFLLLCNALDIKSPSLVEHAGIIQFFELAFDKGIVWMSALQDRNLTTHTYNEATASAVEATFATTTFPCWRTLSNSKDQG